MELTQRIRELTALPGVSGQEDAVREYLLRALQGREDCISSPILRTAVCCGLPRWEAFPPR